ncbi:pseudouridine synthase [Sulfurisoma sediminicola]|uniref:Pseudouridine synthase n=1 Tax=Sulfurisoma sediminicola TaxID=1381557 RepID=A0A497XM88_9PROT|nr:pseudouridine synthase [Sulfurisoma sediminicola]RLJ67469.1 ribosomal large subunit pseudouridine synthase E [Sulfurisoma sediminicola]
MARIVLFNKPCGVLTQFTDSGGRPTLKDYIDVPGVYAAGRLDADSEGLVVLTDDGLQQERISDPRHKLDKVYWAQVEGIPDETALAGLRSGIDLGDFVTRPCRARQIAEPPGLWPRVPPIRVRAAIPTSWLEIGIAEGKNRQIRRMTAKVGFPTLRLVRWAVGEWTLAGLAPGQWRLLAATNRVNPMVGGRVNRLG